MHVAQRGSEQHRLRVHVHQHVVVAHAGLQQQHHSKAFVLQLQLQLLHTQAKPDERARGAAGPRRRVRVRHGRKHASCATLLLLPGSAASLAHAASGRNRGGFRVRLWVDDVLVEAHERGDGGAVAGEEEGRDGDVEGHVDVVVTGRRGRVLHVEADGHEAVLADIDGGLLQLAQRVRPTRLRQSCPTEDMDPQPARSFDDKKHC